MDGVVSVCIIPLPVLAFLFGGFVCLFGGDMHTITAGA